MVGGAKNVTNHTIMLIIFIYHQMKAHILRRKRGKLFRKQTKEILDFLYMKLKILDFAERILKQGNPLRVNMAYLHLFLHQSH